MRIVRTIIRKIVKGIIHPNSVLDYILQKYGNNIEDEQYLRLQYVLRTGSKLHLDNPKTYREKLQWLKLYNRKTEYTKMADKYEVRKYITEKIGEKYLIPLLGVYDKFDDIDFDNLPNQFVLKTNHDSQGIVICTDKERFNVKTARKKLEKHLKENYFYGGREWVYKDIQPRIIAEKYMVDESGTELKDYKIFCFNGEPRMIQVDFNRFSGHKRNLYSTGWEFQDIGIIYKPRPDVTIPKPIVLDEMLKLAMILSKNIPQIRTDFYCINSRVYFGELTFFPEDGYGRFIPKDWDRKFGDWITLPGKGGDL